MSAKALLSASVSAPPAVYIEDTFSTFLYTGNGSTQTITNGIDLAGEGGLVWIKDRGSRSHVLTDTARGAQQCLFSNSTLEQRTFPGVTAFNSSGFTLGTLNEVNQSGGYNYASWTFRKAPKFFDVVTYTGTGSNTTIAHNLGSVPGCIIVKSTSQADNWKVYHRSLTSNAYYILLDSTAAQSNAVDLWNSTTPTSTQFSIGSSGNINTNGATYVAYVFAHDAGGFGDAGTDNVVSCGSYTGNGSTSGPTVTLGWEPQWVLIKASSQSGSWVLFDTMRGIPTGGSDSLLVPNTPAAEETASNWLDVSATGFQPGVSFGNINSSGQTYIYIAIRRGPMKTPTVGTEVFDVRTANSVAANTTVPTTNLTDAVLYLVRSGGAISSGIFFDRLRGLASTNSPWLGTAIANAQFSATSNCLSAQQNTGLLDNWTNYNLGAVNIGYSVFSRAPGFFDVVAYTGTGINSEIINHNLKVKPELVFIKKRNSSMDWVAAIQGNGGYLNSSVAFSAGITFVDLATQSSSISFTVDNNYETNGYSSPYIAYLFATCPGVSKVFNFTGTGTTLQINCGFTSGARLVLIKRTDSTGDWYIWDSARGIISGNDSYLLLNSTAAEVTNTDYIDPYSAGFEISSTAPAAINADGGSYIGLAVA